MSVSAEKVRIAKQLRLSKSFSQNFLVDETSLRAIAGLAQPQAPEAPILEIGPGSGFLTQYLLEGGHPVCAIEVEGRMVRYLERLIGEEPRFRILHQNVLKVDLVPLLKPQGVIVGNLPYHLTGPILFHIAGEMADPDYALRQHLEKAVVMVQKEVGERLTAQPGDKAYSQLSLQIQYWFDIDLGLDVPKSAFYPAPKVDSQVVVLTPRKNPKRPVRNLAFLSRMIKDTFKHRRKIILKSLKLGQYGEDTHLREALLTCDIDPQARPETLSIEKFGALADVLAP